MSNKPFHEVVAERLIQQLKQGTAPWQRPWEPGEPNAIIPMNPITGKRYKGINAIALMAHEYNDPRWMTYKQAETANAQVRKGEKGSAIQYWKFTDEIIKKDEQGNPVLDNNGKPIKVEVHLERPRVFYATVFNAEQIDGLSPRVKKERTWDPIERVEQIIEGSGATVTHGENNRAFYRYSTDSIHLPEKEQFLRADNYYAVALHELGHWTGHSSRMDRDMIHPFGSEGYAKEELRAEITSMILGDELGIGHDPGQHATYIESWISVLKNDPLEIFRAAAEAEKMQQFVLSFEQKQELEHHSELIITKENEDSQVLSVGIESIFNDPDFSLEHFPNNRGNELKLAFSYQGINTIKDVTGVRPSQFYDTAFDKLSLFFGITQDPDYPVDFNTSFERDYLVDSFVRVAEKLIMEIDQQRSQKDSQKKLNKDLNDNPRTLEEGIAMLNEAELKNKTTDQKNQTASGKANIEAEKIWLDIPFKQKEVVKELAGVLSNGQKAIAWDKEKSRWFAHPGANLELLKPWLISPAQDTVINDQIMLSSNFASEKTWLIVPYVQREAVKQIAGTLPDGKKAVAWDKSEKCWFAHPGANLEKLKPWLMSSALERQQPALTPAQEFSDTLQSIGSIISGEHPIMDGKKHRITVEGDKGREKSGFYVGHLDGHPAGYIKNNRTGIEVKWKSKGYLFTDEDRAKMHALAAEKMKVRAEEQKQDQEKAALRVRRQISRLIPVMSPTPYLESKKIEPYLGVFTDKEGQTTYVPAIDANGELWSMQYIKEDGTKRFAKNSRKEGCFHALGGLSAIAAAPAIVIGEGYATAASVLKELGFSVISAFDAGNLELVARALHDKYPDKPIIIIGDDDKHLELTQGINPGKVKALDAANAVNGIAIFPIFAPGEQEKCPKKFSDFNDLATRSILGSEAVKRQVHSIIHDVIKKHECHKKELKNMEQTQDPKRVLVH